MKLLVNNGRLGGDGGGGGGDDLEDEWNRGWDVCGGTYVPGGLSVGLDLF